MNYEAKQGGVGKTVYAIVRIDPILKHKEHKHLEKAMLKHEEDEIKHWGLGKKGCSHSHAKNKEPSLTRNLTVKGFWKKVSKRG